MRILQVCPRYPPRIGGVERHVEALSEQLADRGHDVTVHTADGGSDVPHQARRHGVEVIRHRSFAPANAFHVAPRITGAVRAAQADVVHAHNYHSLTMLLTALGATQSHFVVTTHYHGGSNSPLRHALLRTYRPIGRSVLRRADSVIAVSGWERDQLKRAFDIEPDLIPNGIERDRYHDAEPEHRSQPFLLYVGRLEKYKGVQHAIRALTELQGYELVIAGDGPFRDSLTQLARDTSVDDRVTFLGYVDDDRLPGLYTGAEAVLLLSNFEAYGMTVAEALAAGTPCIVNRRGALVEWTERAGCFGVESLEPSAIHDAVTEATSSPVDRLVDYDWSQVVDALLEVYTNE